MPQRDSREQPRYRVHLSVRFDKAMDFVSEYAENLSRGGLFVRGAHHLELNREVPIQMEVPGYPPFKVIARVAHLITPQMAEAMGRKPGAGFHIVRGPKGFHDAIRNYLGRLGRRRDRGVLGGDHHIASALEAAGYRTQLVASAADLAPAVGEMEAQAPVLGVVVSRTSQEAYSQAAHVLGRAGFVHGVDYLGEVDELLPVFDEML